MIKSRFACHPPLGIAFGQARTPRALCLPLHPRLQRVVECRAKRRFGRSRLRDNAFEDSSSDDDEEWAIMSPTDPPTMNKHDVSISEMQRKYARGVLNLAPEFQRGYVWDKVLASKLIVSVLSGLIVPAVIVHERRDAEKGVVWDIVDGKQRLATLLTYLTGDTTLFTQAPVELQLDDEDEFAERLNGRAFDELPEKLQSAFEDFALTVTIIPAQTASSRVFRIYEAINSGSAVHTTQQLRRAAFWGNYIQLLSALADRSTETGAKFAELTQADQADADKQTDQENILRYFALRRSSRNDFADFKAPMKAFLNNELAASTVDHNLVPEDRDEMQRDFEEVVDAVYEVLGPEPKGMINRGRLCHAVYDMVMIGTSTVLAGMDQANMDARLSKLRKYKAKLSEAYEKVLDDEELIKVRVSRASLRARRDVFVDAFEAILSDRSPRAWPIPVVGISERPFSRPLRELLWLQGHLCAVCGKVITRLEDAEIDHVVPHGPSTFENAQLLHVQCSQQRGMPARAAPPPGDEDEESRF